MEKIIVPKTETPDSVYLWLISIIIAIGTLSLLIIGSNIWTLILLFAILGLTTQFYTHGVPAYHALILMNGISGEMRVIFPGINFKLPWETPCEDGCIDLRVELSEVCEESYATIDTFMKVKYIYTIKPSTAEDNMSDLGEKIILYSSFKPEAIESKGKALFSMLISDYYGKNKGDDLLDKENINKIVFGTEDKPSKIIKKFEELHGAEVTICLKSSIFGERTQQLRDAIAGANAISKAIDKFMESGMSRSEAEIYVKLMNTNGYTQHDLNVKASVTGLKNVRDITILGPEIDNTKNGGEKK